MSTTRSYIKSDSTTPVTTLPIPPTVTEENAAILNIHMPSDIDNAYYPFPSDYTIHYPFNDNDESYEFVMDQSLLWITEDRLDSPRIIVTESHQRQMVSRIQDLGSYVLFYEIEGAHEGEDLASSLILQDLADYVVSIDFASPSISETRVLIVRTYSRRQPTFRTAYLEQLERYLCLCMTDQRCQ